jgi:hypothetical protein
MLEDVREHHRSGWKMTTDFMRMHDHTTVPDLDDPLRCAKASDWIVNHRIPHAERHTPLVSSLVCLIDLKGIVVAESRIHDALTYIYPSRSLGKTAYLTPTATTDSGRLELQGLLPSHSLWSNGSKSSCPTHAITPRSRIHKRLVRVWFCGISLLADNSLIASSRIAWRHPGA